MRTLAIVQPKALRGRIELREGGADGTVVASLTPKRKGRTVDVGPESWTIERPRGAATQIVHATGSEVGSWRRDHRRSLFTVAGDREYEWKRKGRVGRHVAWGFVDETDQLLLRFHYKYGVVRSSGEITIERPDALPERSALVLAVAGLDREISRADEAMASAGVSVGST